MSRICSIIMRESHFQRVQFKFSFFSKKIDDFIIIDPVTSIPDPPFLILDPRSFFSRTSIECIKAKLDTSQYKGTTSHNLATLVIDIPAFSNEKTGRDLEQCGKWKVSINAFLFGIESFER